MIKRFKLSPHRYEGGPVSADVPAMNAPGDTAVFSIDVPDALEGDLAAALSGTLWGAGVISQAAICLSKGTLAVLLVATKPYAGGTIEDLYYRSL